MGQMRVHQTGPWVIFSCPLYGVQFKLANGVNNEHPALVAFMKYQNISTLTREILIELVDHIKVYENGNISVKFKFADELRRIAEYIQLNTSSQAEAV